MHEVTQEMKVDYIPMLSIRRVCRHFICLDYFVSTVETKVEQFLNTHISSLPRTTSRYH